MSQCNLSYYLKLDHAHFKTYVLKVVYLNLNRQFNAWNIIFKAVQCYEFHYSIYICNAILQVDARAANRASMAFYTIYKTVCQSIDDSFNLRFFSTRDKKS